ncbi:hypothetical protein, partial [Prosthecobacter sp.]|uniref:hypothetical protein n=1 Tax=Prosthecobacter sp. TaxID=1965333 RepID=UPI0037C734E2
REFGAGGTRLVRRNSLHTLLVDAVCEEGAGFASRKRVTLTQGDLAQARHALGCDRPHLWC